MRSSARSSRCAVVAQHVPKAIKHFLKMIPTDVIYDYNVLRMAIFIFLTRDRAFSTEGMPIRDDDAMLVDMVEKDGSTDAIWKRWDTGRRSWSLVILVHGVVVVATAWRSFAGARTEARVVRQLQVGAPEPGPGRPVGRRAGRLKARNGYGYVAINT
eukprot:12376301-Heterocapsa_arctica.AAC.1